MIKDLEIELKNITKAYDRPVLKDINLTINNDSYITIVGKSGSGKSTLMNILGLIEEYDDGFYTFNGEKIRKGKDYSTIRSESIGFIFQSYNLIPTMTCMENIVLPLQYSKKPIDEFDNVIDLLKIRDLLQKPVVYLSGGERQRVAIARALILNPSLIIADEPTGNLDSGNRDIVLEILANENRKGRAIVMITHDTEIAMNAKNVYTLEEGVLHENKKK